MNMPNAITRRCPFHLTKLIVQPDGTWKCPVCNYVDTSANTLMQEQQPDPAANSGQE